MSADDMATIRARLEQLKARKAEMEREEQKKREEEQAKAEAAAAEAAGAQETTEQEEGATSATATKADELSVFVRSVDYKVTKDQLQEYFSSCGKINRCTILVDHYTKKPKGAAYIEFAEPSGVEYALKLDGHLLAGRTITVVRKRENKPNFNRRGPRRRFRRQ